MISIFSFFKFIYDALYSYSLGPTQAPIASTFSSFEYTAIFVLEPASLDILLSLQYHYISQALLFQIIFLTKPGCVLETIT